ncbi:hypothetical protein C7B65_15145 [Phormidesmis priestleyi ULC007]|uniref:Uncharacterized protein n=1 Tax=Phormidesmis priestleyi ULC007 TaxID=1920490 RepID=A0A2T1DD69_9CYAN|nr:hypothetical protein [Phormidesmis priestleyi]PSB18428.1 hypothetical protein C7B65_15145 [Phormidesmis priestleyi ULC007]PZO48845.1 MAG: hypothetical protein DCF14_16045 [Phormidesmis priestleyi]
MTVQIEILASDVPVTKAQQAVLDALKGRSTVSFEELIDQSGFSSPLPLISRLNHLIERGRLRLLPE